MFQKLANVTTLVAIPPATTPGLLNFSATVSRSAMTVVLGSRPSTTGDGLLRHLTAVDIRNHQTLHIDILDSNFYLSLAPVNFSNVETRIAEQRTMSTSPTSLVMVHNDNVSSYTNVLLQRSAAATITVTTETIVDIRGVTSVGYCETAVQLLNINLPTAVVLEKTYFVALVSTAATSSFVSGAPLSSSALIHLSCIPLITDAPSSSVQVGFSDSVIVGDSPLFAAVHFAPVFVPIPHRTSSSRRKSSIAEVEEGTQVAFVSIQIDVQGSTLQGISSVLSSNTTGQDGEATMDIGTSRMSIVNSSLQCSGAGQTSANYGVAVLGPNDAMTMMWAISTFQDCVRLISGGGSAIASTTFPGINWACNLWNQRSLTRSGIRALLGGVGSVYATPQIDSRYGDEICRSESETLRISYSRRTDTRTALKTTTKTIFLSTSFSSSPTNTMSISNSIEPSATLTPTLTSTVSRSKTTSTTLSGSITPSHTETDSPTISIDPCNTTFRGSGRV
ncbi:unnamed protein product [Bodo saltans]|uniref:Uncharacterized protein n=1 Tax=Bodo saltans TaxID=75058 RepID=A0A0S4JL39_BODSA|nr:unnamed protein product [Bodo saltans]|eukprot:CUG92230.1 unnamed protein product [Bodo saltans]